MKREDESQLDVFLKEILKENTLVYPQSANYTQNIMHKVTAFEQRKKQRYMVLKGIGVSLVVAMILLLLFLSIRSAYLFGLSPITMLTQFSELLAGIIPFRIPLQLLAVVILHFVFTRVLIMAYLLRRKRLVFDLMG